MAEEFSHPVFKTEEEFVARAKVVFDEELAEDPMGGWYYLSFVDPSLAPPEEEQRPGGPSWLGGCFVYAHGTGTAAAEAHLQGCNPGGQVACWGPFPAPREGYRNRLLTSVEEIDASDPGGAE